MRYIRHGVAGVLQNGLECGGGKLVRRAKCFWVWLRELGLLSPRIRNTFAWKQRKEKRVRDKGPGDGKENQLNFATNNIVTMEMCGVPIVVSCVLCVSCAANCQTAFIYFLPFYHFFYDPDPDPGLPDPAQSSPTANGQNKIREKMSARQK